MPDLSVLSERELEILCLLAKGKSNKEIAQELFISVNTVKVHLRNVFAKIEVSSRTEATLYAVRAGLVEGMVETGANGQSEPVVAPADSGTLPEEALPQEKVFASPAPDPSTPPWWQSPWLFGGLIVLFLLLVLALSQLFQQETSATPEPTTIPVETGWEARAELTFPRFGHATAVYENQVFVIGGETSEGVVAATQRYNPETNEWTTLAKKPTAVTDVLAAVLGGKVYVPGGKTADGKVTDLMEVFDPVANRWDTGPTLPSRISGYALAAFEGKLYLFGGWDGERYSDKVYVFTPDLQEWRELATLPGPRAFLSAVVVENKIYVIGGFDGKQALNSNLIFTPERSQSNESPWKEATALPSGRYGMGVVYLADTIYVLSGVQEDQSSASQLTFHPESNEWNTWANFEALNNPSWNHFGVAVIGARVYAMGGLVDGVPTSQNVSYQAIYILPLPVITKP